MQYFILHYIFCLIGFVEMEFYLCHVRYFCPKSQIILTMTGL